MTLAVCMLWLLRGNMWMKADASACSGPSKTYNGIRVKEKWTKLRPSAKKTKLKLMHMIRSIVQLCAATSARRKQAIRAVCLSFCTIYWAFISLFICSHFHTCTAAELLDYGKYKHSYFSQYWDHNYLTPLFTDLQTKLNKNNQVVFFTAAFIEF